MQKRGDKYFVSFLTSNAEGNYSEATLPVNKKIEILSSNGTSQIRFAVMLTITLGKVTKTVIATLANRRHSMPVIIGRNFLKDRFLVNPEKQFLFGR